MAEVVKAKQDEIDLYYFIITPTFPSELTKGLWFFVHGCSFILSFCQKIKGLVQHVLHSMSVTTKPIRIQGTDFSLLMHCRKNFVTLNVIFKFIQIKLIKTFASFIIAFYFAAPLGPEICNFQRSVLQLFWTHPHKKGYLHFKLYITTCSQRMFWVISHRFFGP